jgi:hypothetical protein
MHDRRRRRSLAEPPELGPDVVGASRRGKFGSNSFWTPAKTNVAPRKARSTRIDHGSDVQLSTTPGARWRRTPTGFTWDISVAGARTFVVIKEMFDADDRPMAGERYVEGKNLRHQAWGLPRYARIVG